MNDTVNVITATGWISDQDWSELRGHEVIPGVAHCTECGETAFFVSAPFAARYECSRCRHAMAAMWVLLQAEELA